MNDRILPPDVRRDVLTRCIDALGVTPSAMFPEGDNRVGFTMVVDDRTILMVGAVPPSTAEVLEAVVERMVGSRRVLLRDFHVGTTRGEPTPEVDVAWHIALIRRTLVLPSWLDDDFRHAHALALKAKMEGHRWTGREEDLPPRLREHVVARGAA